MKKIIVTIGPAIWGESTLNKINNKNIIYRINGAHIEPKSIRNLVDLIKQNDPKVEILVDLPGNKIRTSNLLQPVTVKKGKIFDLPTFNLNFPECYKYLKIEDSVYVDDSTLHFKVENIEEGKITFLSQSDGILKNNKGVHVRGIHNDIPFLLQKDKEIIKEINQLSIQYVGLSFVRDIEDINIAKKLINNGKKIINKIETKSAIKNLDDILDNVEYILVDRGDLSTDVGLEKIPFYQNYIVQKARNKNIKIFLATQFLKNMEKYPVPTIAEVIDLHNTINLGIFGIQLSEETSIGKYPIQCIDFVNTMQKEVNTNFIN